MKKEYYSTGEAAEACGVSQQTIIRCFDTGKIQGYYVPGSRFRRIPRESLIKFMRESGMPLSSLDTGKKKVLIVDDEPEIVDFLSDLLVRDGRFDVKTASGGYDAGLLTQQFRPDVIVLDFQLPDINANVVAKTIRSNPALAATQIIIISGLIEEDKIKSLFDVGINAFFRKPFQFDALVNKIAELLRI